MKQLLIAVFCLCPFPDLHPDGSRTVPTDRPPYWTSADSESPWFQTPFPKPPGERLFPFISTHGCGMTLVQRQSFVWGLVCRKQGSSLFHACSEVTPRVRSTKYPYKVMMLQLSYGVTGDDTALSLMSNMIQRKQEFSKRAEKLAEQVIQNNP